MKKFGCYQPSNYLTLSVPGEEPTPLKIKFGAHPPLQIYEECVQPEVKQFVCLCHKLPAEKKLILSS